MWRAPREKELTIASLGVRNTVRRQGRTLATIALLACGSFLVIAVGANRHGPDDAGTGGFSFYGETTLPVYHDLNSKEGLDAFGLDEKSVRGYHIVQLRMREGDEASCLNLNRAQVPRLLGVPTGNRISLQGAAYLRERGAFTFVKTITPPAPRKPSSIWGGVKYGIYEEGNWRLLERKEPDGAVPAVGDVNTVVWSLGKSVGDTLDYIDDRGKPFRIRIVGLIANSILQGGLLISEENFTTRFPSQDGYQIFLVDEWRAGYPADAPPVGKAEVTRTLSRALEDVGLDLTPARDRLAAFNAVENTYLSIFAALGGLGLLLGSVGLGVVVLRNVLERRGELALLRAVGFRGRALHWLIFSEHSMLLTLGLIVGVVSALVAVIPAAQSPGAPIPYASLALTLVAVFVSGFFWTWGATMLALRGPLLAALRNE